MKSASPAPVSPLRAVNAAEISFLVGPFVPNRHAVFVEIFDVGVAAQKPEQFVNDRFDVQLLRGQERKSRPARPQVVAGLCTEDRQRAGAGAIGAGLTFFKNEPKKVMILPHAKTLSQPARSQSNSSAGLWRQASRLHSIRLDRSQQVHPDTANHQIPSPILLELDSDKHIPIFRNSF